MSRQVLVTIGLLAALAGPVLAQPATPPPPPPPQTPQAPRVPRTPRVPHTDWEGGPGETERIAKSFKVRQGATFVLVNLAGDVTVTAGAGDEIAIEAVKHAVGRSTNDARRQLEAARVDFSVGDVDRASGLAGRVEARTLHGDRRSHVKVDFAVTVPSSTLVDVRAMSGDVRLTGVKAEARVETVSGSVHASNLAAPATLKAVSGDVSVNGAAVDGELALNSISGDVWVKDSRIRALSATTVSGDLQVAGGSCERAEVSAVNGDVEINGAIAKGGRYEIRSHSGDVRLVVDGRVGFTIDANTFSGEIASSLPLTSQSRSEDDGRPGQPKSLRGRYGDASAQFDISTFSGSITIVKRQ
jgi:DUF4097 and DUF4098 domain-containing protein YvlB